MTSGTPCYWRCSLKDAATDVRTDIPADWHEPEGDRPISVVLADRLVVLNLKYRVASVFVFHAAPPFMQHIVAAKADRLKPVV